MKLVVNIDSKKEREELKKFLKKYPGKIMVRSSVKPIESLIAFANSNSLHVKKVDIPPPGMNAMNDRIFVDTNLWVYLFTESESEDDKKKRTMVISLLRESSEIVVSGQVLAQLVNVFLKKMSFPFDKIQRILHEIIDTVEVIPVDGMDITYALDIVERYKISWFDACIVATAISSETNLLYSEDMQHDLTIDESIKIKNPFV